jgi:nitroreductase
MDFLSLVHRRYSVREYKPDQIEQNKLKRVLEAAQFAPTAANRQPFQLIVIHTADNREELLKIYDRDWFVNAPIVICACGIPEQAWLRSDGKSYLDVDIAIVMDHISLAATNLGLGTCWVASFNVDAAREVLHIPASADPIIFMSLGYPVGKIETKERKPFSDLIRYEHW